MTARIPETYQWLLVPVQATPQAAVSWEAIRLSGQDALAVRASKKLRNDELLLTGFAATRLRMELDRVPLWRGDHVAVKQLAEDFARYLYLPRLKDSSVLLGAIRDGVSLLNWEQDAFAFADSVDESDARYRGLRVGQLVMLASADGAGLLVKPDVARKQRDAETVPLPGGTPGGGTNMGGGGTTPPAPTSKTPGTTKPDPVTPPRPPKRFHGEVKLDADRVAVDASRVAAEVIAHLTGLVGAKVKVTLHVEAEIPSGVRRMSCERSRRTAGR